MMLTIGFCILDLKVNFSVFGDKKNGYALFSENNWRTAFSK